MTNLFADRGGKLIRMLGSPVDAECVSAVRDLSKAFGEAGLDFHWLADLAVSAWPLTAPKSAFRPDSKKPWQILADELLKHANDPTIVWGSKERDFLRNMRKSRYAPTAGQEKWMRDINARRGKAAA